MAATTTAVVGLTVLWLRANAGGVDEAELTAASIGVALVFGMVTALQNALGERRKSTVDLLSAFSTADALSESDGVVARRLSSGLPIPVDPEPELDQHLIRVLDYYEFLCRAARSGAVDRRMLRDLRGPALTALLEAADGYIISRRDVYGPTLYDANEWFAKEQCARTGRAVSPSASTR